MARAKVTSLPVWEQTTCWVIGVTGILYGMYRVHVTSMELKSTLRYVNDSWGVLGGKQDVGDYEWAVYSSHVVRRLVPMLCLHLLTSRVLACLRLHATGRKLVYVTVGAVTACWLLWSWRFVTLLVVTAAVFFVLSTLGMGVGVWAGAAAAMLVCNSHTQRLTHVLQISASEDYFTAVYIWASVILRCTCFAIERVWSLSVQTVTSPSSSSSSSSSQSSSSQSSPSQSSFSTAKVASDATAESAKDGRRCRPLCSDAEIDCCRKQKRAMLSCRRQPSVCEKEHNRCVTTSRRLYGWTVLSKVPDFLDLCVYVLYVPLLLNGPPLTFKSFKEQIERPDPVSRGQCVDIACRFLAVGLWFFFNILLLHGLFFAALCEEPAALQSRDKWSIVTSGYLLGQFMTNKYVVIYGAMRLTAALDGLQLAANPACISYIYAYSDMWKSFDRGLYGCLKRYVYVPLGGSQRGVVRSGLSVLATFCVMGYWHGGGYRYMAWALLNVLGLLLEHLGSALQRSTPVGSLLAGRLGAVGMRRVQGVLFYPLFIMATTSNMFFLAGPAFAHLYLSSLCLHWDGFLTFGLVTYCMIQNAKHLEERGLTKLS